MSLTDLLKEPFTFPPREEVDALVEEAMRCLPAARSDLSSRVSHSIRTPLAAILGFQEVLDLDNRLSDEDRKLYTELIASETHRLQRFIDSLKVFQALFAGELPLERKKQDLRQTIDTAVARCGYEGKAKGVRLQVIRASEEIPLTADHRRLGLAIEHVLLNAVRATPKGEIVDIEAVVTKQAIQITVEDQGYGMDPAHIDNMYKPFYRTARPDDNGGELGIGLTIVRSIVERHEGSVQIESAVMKGTRVTLTFPF